MYRNVPNHTDQWKIAISEEDRPGPMQVRLLMVCLFVVVIILLYMLLFVNTTASVSF